MRMLSTALDPRRNSLNAIRLGLASAVIVSHAWPLNGFSDEPAVGGLTLGAWAVLGFFGISGYLITLSRLAGRPAADFWIARALRILPGLLMALVIVAFVFAPLGALLQQEAYWSPGSAAAYVLRNALLYPFGVSQNSIDGTLVGFTFRDWNGPLWTLFYEGNCYVLIGLAATLLRRRRDLAAFMVLVSVTSLLLSLTHVLDGALHGLGVRVVPMVLAFAVGSLLAMWRDRVPVTASVVGAALIGLLGAILLGVTPTFAAIVVPYLLLVGGAVLPLQAVGARFDVSYGVYIYAWPVQQLLVLILGWNVLPGIMIASVVVITFPLAWISFVMIERPAMRLRTRVGPVARTLHRCGTSVVRAFSPGKPAI